MLETIVCEGFAASQGTHRLLCDDFQQFDCRFAVTIDQRGTTINDIADFGVQQLRQGGSGLDLPQLAQLNFSQHVVFNQDSTEGRFLRLDSPPNFRVERGHVQPHDPILHGFSGRMSLERDLANVPFAIGIPGLMTSMDDDIQRSRSCARDGSTARCRATAGRLSMHTLQARQSRTPAHRTQPTASRS